MDKELADYSPDSKFILPSELGDERQTVRKILLENYGLALTSFKRLESYDDVNYLVEANGIEAISSLQRRKSSQYILRIINASESRNPRRIEAIGAVMKHVHTKGIVTQDNVKDLRGQEISYHCVHSHGRANSHVVILRTFLPGTVMSSVAITPSDVFTCGIFIARVTRALQDFHHQFFDSSTRTWGLSNRSDVEKCTRAVKDEALRCLVEETLEACQREISSVAHKLRKGQIHGDIGLSNVILPDGKKKLPKTKSQSSTHGIPVDEWGLIDFHETRPSFTIYELATSSAYVMTNDQPILMERLDIPGHLLAGYRTLIPLDLTERRIFPYLVLTSLCVILLNGCYYSEINPSNAEYVEENSVHGWWLLGQMWKKTPAVLQTEWERIAQESERQNATYT